MSVTVSSYNNSLYNAKCKTIYTIFYLGTKLATLSRKSKQRAGKVILHVTSKNVPNLKEY